MSKQYHEMNDHDILVIVAETTERQESHLNRINSTLSKHDRRIMTIEVRREVEGEMGYAPPSKKKKALEGGMYGGSGAFVISLIYAGGRLAGWW